MLPGVCGRCREQVVFIPGQDGWRDPEPLVSGLRVPHRCAS